jgi:uncharacterized membrane protein YoaK (UPF0700 family)
VLRRRDPTRVRDGLLVALTLSTGAVDAVSWLVLGKVFSAFMTGNIVFVGLLLGGADGPPVSRVLTALGAFGAGSAIGAWIVRRAPGAGLVWPRSVTVALAAALAAQIAFLGLWVAVAGHPSSTIADALIGMSALAMGAQATAVFALGVRVVFTTAITASFAVLLGDLSGWRQPPMERRRLLGMVAGLLAGAVVGTLLVVHARVWAAAFAPAVTALVIVAAAVAFPATQRRAAATPAGQVGLADGTVSGQVAGREHARPWPSSDVSQHRPPPSRSWPRSP